MPYLFRSTPAHGASQTLIEMTPRELRALTPEAGSAGRHLTDSAGNLYRRADSNTAHRWVKSGAVHETSLYVDCDGRIRRATNDESALTETESAESSPPAADKPESSPPPSATRARDASPPPVIVTESAASDAAAIAAHERRHWSASASPAARKVIAGLCGTASPLALVIALPALPRAMRPIAPLQPRRR